jgi:hypothetical protein
MLQNLVFPNSLQTIGSFAFSRCRSLDALVFPKNVKEIGAYAFEKCATLTEVRFEGAWNVVRTERPLIPGDEDMTSEDFLIHCFKNSPELESILRKERREARRREKLLAKQTKGKPVSVPADSKPFAEFRVPDGLQVLQEGVFSYCINLIKVELPVTLRHIENYAFRGCSGMTKLVIPDGTLSIGERVFEGCRLEDVFIPSSVTSIAEDAFRGAKRFTLHTPRGSYAADYAKRNRIPYVYSDLPKFRNGFFARTVRSIRVRGWKKTFYNMFHKKK